jgi:hypothetical protein
VLKTFTGTFLEPSTQLSKSMLINSTNN